MNPIEFPGLGLEFQINRVAFTLFGKDIYWYGVIIALGFLLGVIYCYYQARHYGVNGVFSCCDCGLCTYFACNFGLKPSQAMQKAKAQLQQSGVKPVKEVKYPTDNGIDNKRLPTGRLLLRLDLKRYDCDAPMAGDVTVDTVRIPLKMHIGGPDKPVVSVGQSVTRGQLIAQPDGMGANIHASISGTVTQVSGDCIEIRK